MAKNIPDVNRKLAKAGAPVTLHRGHGYQYFIYNDEQTGEWADLSVPVCYFNQMPFEFWVAEGLNFAAEIRAQQVAE